MWAPLRIAAAATLAAAALGGCAAEIRSAAVDVPFAPVDPSALATLAGPAVWRVETHGCGWVGTGSAIAIDDRHLVTNHHVILYDTSPRLVSLDGTVRQGRVIGARAEPDVAVIEVDGSLGATLALAPETNLAESEPLVALGYPMPDFEFEVTTGLLVDFVGPGGSRQAFITDVPIEHGNSGGAALRADGTVAGVVTQMTSDARKVAIVLTAAAVQPIVDQAIAAPGEVLSDCGQGPDYVPPVPPDYELGAIPEPATQASGPSPTLPGTSAPESPIPPATPATVPTTTDRRPTTTTIPCPTGGPEAAVTSVSAVPAEPEGWWEVTVDGEVLNESDATVDIRQIDVTIPGDPPRAALGFGVEEEIGILEPGDRRAWRASDYTYSPGSPPTTAEVSLQWRWAPPSAGCPTTS